MTPNFKIHLTFTLFQNEIKKEKNYSRGKRRTNDVQLFINLKETETKHLENQTKRLTTAIVQTKA